MTIFTSSWDRPACSSANNTSRSHSPRNHRDGFAKSRREGSNGPPRPHCASSLVGRDGKINRPG